MQIAELSESVALIVPMLFLVEGIVALVVWFAYGSRGGRGARIAAWLGLVTLSLWCGSALAYVALMLVFFNLGAEATMVAAVVVTVLMVAMPFFWAYVVRNRHGNDAGTPQAR
jgi:hypothetical protein